MKHLFVPYELAVKAKEKGLILTEENCLATYERTDYGIDDVFSVPVIGGSLQSDLFECAAPLYQQIVDWFREKHGLIIGVDWHGTAYFYLITTILPYDRTQSKNFEGFHEALTKALEEAFELI